MSALRNNNIEITTDHHLKIQPCNVGCSQVTVTEENCLHENDTLLWIMESFVTFRSLTLKKAIKRGNGSKKENYRNSFHMHIIHFRTHSKTSDE